MDIPKLKLDFSQPLVFTKAREGLFYLVEDAPETREFPLKGERFSIQYDFHPSSGGYFGYEHLCVIAYRPDEGNLVKYFTSLVELDVYLGRMTFSLDTTYAEEQIRQKAREILVLARDYGLEGSLSGIKLLS